MTPSPEIFRASNETAAQFLWRRVRCSQIQKLARIRHDAGEPFDWRGFGFVLTTERLWLSTGVYRHDDWRRSQSWPSANAATCLLYGRNAPFACRDDVPDAIWLAVEEGVTAGLALGHAALSSTAIAHRLDVNAAFRRKHRLWMVGATDKSRSELREESRLLATERQRARRQADRDRKQAQRRAAGMSLRADYLDHAALRREAIALAGISERTFKRRSKAEQEALLEAARNARGNGPSVSNAQYINITASADRLRPHELSHMAAAVTPAALSAHVSRDIVSTPVIAESATIAVKPRGRAMKSKLTPVPYPLPKNLPVLIKGLPVQTFLLTEQAADRAASAYWRKWETGARVIGILDEHERWLARMMTMHQNTPEEIAEARAIMNRRFTEIVAAGLNGAAPIKRLPDKEMSSDDTPAPAVRLAGGTQ